MSTNDKNDDYYDRLRDAIGALLEALNDFNGPLYHSGSDFHSVDDAIDYFSTRYNVDKFDLKEWYDDHGWKQHT